MSCVIYIDRQTTKFNSPPNFPAIQHIHTCTFVILLIIYKFSVSTQSELISSGGLHVLLSLLSGASGHSSAVDEELSKAITFVLQCCLPQQQQQQRQADDSNGKLHWPVGKVGNVGKLVMFVP